MRQFEPRIRRPAFWIGLAACILTAGLWMMSLTFQTACSTGKTGVTFFLRRGSVGVFRSAGVNAGWHFSRSQATAWWWPKFGSVGKAWYGFIPCWCPLVVFAAPTVVLWCRAHKCLENGCQKCGYDLTGNVSGVCPECGTAVRNAETQKAETQKTPGNGCVAP